MRYIDLPERKIVPDIIIVSDQLETILIIEAKDFAPKLIKGEQMSKSIRVIMNMSKQLRAIDLGCVE